MRRFTDLVSWVIVAALVCGAATSGALAAGSYNCRSDRKLDVPMQFTPVVDGDGRLHLSAFGGSDKSKYVAPSTWRVYSAVNAPIDAFPDAMVVFVSMDMFRETNVDGLQPGATYTVELTSVDFCNNPGIVRKSVTMPSGMRESNPPALSAVVLAQVGLQTFTKVIQFSVTDDSGVRNVSVLVNGAPLQNFVYGDGLNVRWWVDYYPYDNVLSTLEGPNYYVAYPDALRGQPAQVTVVVTDLYGNQVTRSALLNL